MAVIGFFDNFFNGLWLGLWLVFGWFTGWYLLGLWWVCEGGVDERVAVVWRCGG